jgi:hypothetical protein
MRAYVLAFAALLFAPALTAQTLTVTTDKAVYASGEPVVVTIRLANRTDQPVPVWMPASPFACGYDFMLDGFWRWQHSCLPAIDHKMMPARSTYVWTRILDPIETGRFGQGGRHTVRVRLATEDSVSFEAAAYRGGLLAVTYFPRDSLRVRSVRDSLRATVRKERTYHFSSSPSLTGAEWELRDIPLDSAVARYAPDARFQDLRAVARLGFGASSLVGTVEATRSHAGALGVPAPHPFTDVVTLPFIPARSGAVEADLYDGLGRHVQSVYRGAAVSGEALRLSVAGAALPAGIYVLRVQASGATYAQRLVRAPQ